MKTKPNLDKSQDLNTFFLEDMYRRAKKHKRYTKSKIITVYYFIISFSLFFILNIPAIKNHLNDILFAGLFITNMALMMFIFLSKHLSYLNIYSKNPDLLNFEYELQKHLKIKYPENTESIQNFIIFSEIIHESKYSSIFHNIISSDFLLYMLNNKKIRGTTKNKDRICDMYWETIDELFHRIDSQHKHNFKNIINERKNEIVKKFIFNN